MRRPTLIVLTAALASALPAATAPTLLEQSYREMYDLQFGDAHRTLAVWEKQHPDDPMGPVSDAAAYLYSEFDRLHILQSEYFVDNESFFHTQRVSPDPAVRQQFLNALNKTQQLSARQLARSPADENALFADVLRLGLYSDYLAMVEKRYMASLGAIKQGRLEAEKLLSAHPDCYDAYLAIGTENYVLSQKPAPIRWILHAAGAETDKQTGIEKLRLTAEKGHYLRPYARLLLAVAALRDNNRPRARQTLASLAGEFPHNNLYRDELAKLQ